MKNKIFHKLNFTKTSRTLVLDSAQKHKVSDIVNKI